MASLIGISLAALVLSFTACTAGADGTEALRRIKEGAVVVDVRSAEEYAEGHLEGSRNIPHTDIREKSGLLPSDKGTPIVVYCRSGRRSELARETLRDLGYSNVTNGGGLEDLRRAGATKGSE